MADTRVAIPLGLVEGSFTQRLVDIISMSPKHQPKSPFAGRSISVVGDLSIQEQIYLYAQTRRVKEAVRSGKDMDALRINDRDVAIYLIFMAPSTRTRNSFLSAAQFHNVKVNDFDCATSSFNKKESITDAVKMLCGYSIKRSIFVIRSYSEGACTWLHESMREYAAQLDIPAPTFINAADGRHAHPTHEYFDQFSFLEQLQWSHRRIHIALVGDLFHSRTVHSKAQGLSVFREVQVDLVAPAELQLPDDVLTAMRQQGFTVKIFEDIQTYMDEPEQAKVWYFTNLHLNRFGDKLRDQVDVMHRAVLFREEWVGRMGPDVRFYHPLPAHEPSVLNTVPDVVKDTYLNAWDNQAMNAYYLRVALLGMVAGTLGQDFKGVGKQPLELRGDFIEEVPVDLAKPPQNGNSGNLNPLVDGMVIDHICAGESPRQIWERITKIRKVLHLSLISSQGVYESTSAPGQFKGIISLPGVPPFTFQQMTRLAMLVPNCTLNVIQESRVRSKFRLRTPPCVSGVADVYCKNPNCISFPARFESVDPFFNRAQDSFVCKYCETSHRFADIWA